MMNQNENQSVIKKSQKGFSLVSLIFVMLAMSSVGLGVGHNVSNRAISSVASVESSRALYAADGILQHIMATNFMNDSNWEDNNAPGTIDFGPGLSNQAEVDVTYNIPDNYSATITVTSTVGDTTRIIQQDIARAIPINDPVFAGGNFTFNGPQPCILWGFICWDAGNINGNLGTGGTISRPTYFTVSGTETQNMSVSLPEADVSGLVQYTDTTHSGDLTLGPGASLLNPYYYNTNIHVTGNLTIENWTLIDSVVVVDGDITINGNFVLNGTLASGGSINGDLADNSIMDGEPGPNGETLPTLFAEDDIYVNVDGLGNITRGLVYAGGDLTYYADLEGFDILELIFIDGALISGGDMYMTNEFGYLGVSVDTSLLSSIAQQGSFRLTNWEEL